jgi:hypothetical protein
VSPRVAVPQVSADDLRQQLEEMERRCGFESLYFFNKKILGYSEMERRPHAAVADFIQAVVTKTSAKKSGKGLMLEPRGAFKTTQLSQGTPMWILEHDPNARILLDSSVLQNSIDNLRVIKAHYENNQKFRYLFGNRVGTYWVTEEITVAHRTNLKLKEPSIRCSSVERMQAGPHYTHIFADDLVSDLNSRTIDGRRAIIDHFKLLFSLLDPGGVLLAAGTRYHYDDLYAFILSLEDFDRRIMNAETSGPGGTLYFPQRLTAQFLKETKALQGRALYAAQYLNDPAPEDEDSAFQRTWFKPYEVDPQAAKKKERQFLPENRNSFITIDPGGEKKKSDEWVIFTAHYDELNNKYFDKIIKGHWKMRECWDLLFGEVARVSPLMVGLETTGGQKWLYEALTDEMRRRNVHFMVQPLAHAVDSKDYRIKRLQPQYQAGSIFHSPEMGDLEDQLLRYPKGADDIPDAASMILEIGYAPRPRRVKEAPPRSADEWFMREHRKGMARRPGHSILGDNA